MVDYNGLLLPMVDSNKPGLFLSPLLGVDTLAPIHRSI
jgi:hypothetical protein